MCWSSPVASTLPGIHLNFLLILVAAAAICALAGMLIGLPTLRLRGDYIAIVTLAFGEIIGTLAVNGTSVHLGGGMTLTAGNLGISGVDSPYFPGIGLFNELNLRPWYWLIFGVPAAGAVREPAAAGLAAGAGLGGATRGRGRRSVNGHPARAHEADGLFDRRCLRRHVRRLLRDLLHGGQRQQFQFGFSIFILGMVIIGGLGSIWGAVAGGLLLGYINYYLIPDVLNSLPSKIGLNFQLTEIEFGIYGFLLVIMMILRPQGLIPERRRRLELTGRVAATDSELGEPSAVSTLELTE